MKHSSDFEERYNNESIVNEESSFQQVFHDLWIVFFVPSEVIQKDIGNAFRANREMEVGQYTSIDLTMTITPAESKMIVKRELNITEDVAISGANKVVNFVSRLLPNDPFMLITDDTNMILALKDRNDTDNFRDGYDRIVPAQFKMENDVPIFARYKMQSNWAKKQGFKDTNELLPQKLVDFDTADSPIHTPEIFYDIVTNLYLMTMGRCVVTYTPGTFNDMGVILGRSTLSRLASLIGYDSNCYCEMVIKHKETLNIISDKSFLDYVYKAAIYDKRDAPSTKHYFRSPIIKDGADEMTHISRQIKETKEQHGGNSTDLLKEENKFPQWMEEYLAWHRATKSQLTRSNWNTTKYLIAGCFETYHHCGGISDRLKPLPMLLWEAHQSQRILLIWWENPKPLEEWLVPPNHNDGGVDWTVPSFLKEELLKARPNIRASNGMSTVTTWKRRELFRKGMIRERAVVYNIQSPDAGEDHYTEEQILYAKQLSGTNSGPSNDTLVSLNSPVIGSTYRDVFHNLFRRFFTPSPRLASLINSKMKLHNLVPDEYTAVHLRALYGERSHRDLREALELAALGANCASNLYPGTPVYFASDMSFAVDSAHAYGNLHGLPIVSLDFDPDVGNTNPIHLDKDPDWKNRSASAYDSTFVDLYLLAESRCVAYSNGGYGLFGSLLSHEPDCRMRFFKGRKKIKRCTWMNDKFERHQLQLPKVDDVVAGGRVGNNLVAQ